jgi:hypothetical protein
MEENTVDKEKILEMSRKENKNKDIAELDVEKKANNIAVIVGSIFALILILLQAVTKNGVNYGIAAIVEIMCAVSSCYKYLCLKRKKHLLLAIYFILISIIFTSAAIISFYK